MVVGFVRRDWSYDYFCEQMCKGIEEFFIGIGSEDLWNEFVQGLFYCFGNMDDLESYFKLKNFLGELDEKCNIRGN